MKVPSSMKIFSFQFFLAFLFFLGFGLKELYSQGDLVESDQLLAIVNGVEIRKSYVLAELKKAGIVKPDSQAIQNALASLVQQEILYQEAMKLEMEKSKELLRAQEEFNRKALTELVVQKKIRSQPPSEGELRLRYSQLLKSLPKEEYKIRHIVLPTRRKALEVMERLKKGENFSLLAMESLEKQTADRGGELGWQNKATLVLSAYSLIQKLKPGQVGGPILSSMGWELIELLAVRPLRVPSYEELKPQLIQQIEQENLKKYVQELIASSRVQIFPLNVSSTTP
ncbi:peptidylprolyl isomerase [Candidatus Methylacidiphilum infernorum]|uniref:peptidylprolyl isomerase n=1 Tax=Methylacidiphilum infernorum (isolate V4) TaxID=481448 RepID=B3DZ41_METI4|nr:peptidylprolyl isomerase [Candidatus Methylacidiphilum infernorum]ACD84133.1 Parvulin-like peptidyl-prolyl isomerase [Methylacidiphilum infernorum V4]